MAVQQVLSGNDGLRVAREQEARPLAISEGSGRADLPASFVELLDPADDAAPADAAPAPPPRATRSSAVPQADGGGAPQGGAVMRGGGGGGVGSAAAEMSQLVVLPEDAADRPELFPQRADGAGALVDVNAQQVDLRRHNSWMLKLHEVAPTPTPLPTPTLY